jgi:hypothetical protein
MEEDRDRNKKETGTFSSEGKEQTNVVDVGECTGSLYLTTSSLILDPIDGVVYPTTESHLKYKSSDRVFSFGTAPSDFSTEIAAGVLKIDVGLPSIFSAFSPCSVLIGGSVKLSADYVPFANAPDYTESHIGGLQVTPGMGDRSIASSISGMNLWTDRDNIMNLNVEPLCITTKDNLHFSTTEIKLDSGLGLFSKDSSFFIGEKGEGILSFADDMISKIVTEYPETGEVFIGANNLLGNLRIGEIGSGICSSVLESTTLQNQFLALSQDYSSFAINSVTSLRLGGNIFLPVTTEYFGNISLAKATVVDSKDDIEGQIEDIGLGLIARLDTMASGLGGMLQGAKQAADSANPEKVRHCLTSLRELITQVIHTLAPDREIRKWSQKPDLYDKQRPTRRARMLYICRGVGDTDMADFVKSDIDTSLKFINTLNIGTHKITADLRKNHLNAMVSRAVGLLGFLLDISGK